MHAHADDIKDRMRAACESAREVAFILRQPYDREQAEAQFQLGYDAATGLFTAAANALLQRWRSAQEDVVLNADAKCSRGLQGTVHLALLQLEALPADVKEASMQLLGLLALCPAVAVPWSLFDGLSHVSAATQRCKVRREDGSDGSILEDAEIVSDAANGENLVVQLVDGGQEISVARSRVEFGPHILGMVVKEGRYQVQLLTPQPYMRGARVELHGIADNGRYGRVIQSNNDGDVDTVRVMFGCETGKFSRPQLLCTCTLCLIDSRMQVL
jgi:hypothetical protein